MKDVFETMKDKAFKVFMQEMLKTAADLTAAATQKAEIVDEGTADERIVLGTVTPEDNDYEELKRWLIFKRDHADEALKERGYDKSKED